MLQAALADYASMFQVPDNKTLKESISTVFLENFKLERIHKELLPISEP
jgi:hypothetical protein